MSSSLTRALHPEEEEHGDDGQEGAHRVGDDELERVVIGDEEYVEHGGGREVSGQEARGVGQHRTRVDDVQAEEGDRPHAVEDLQRKKRAIKTLYCTKGVFVSSVEDTLVGTESQVVTIHRTQRS